MRVLLLIVAFLGTAFAFTPSGIINHKKQSSTAVKAFGNDSISTLLSLDITQAQKPLIAGAVALLGIIGFAVSSNGNNADTTETSSSTTATKAVSTPKPAEAVDVSIPYNAAAMLEYTKQMGPKFDAAKFAKFEALYEEKVVAQVTAKKVARDCQLEAARLEAIVAKADADIAALASN